MAKGIGRLVQFGIAKETTRGTAIASPDFWVPWAELVLDEKEEQVFDQATVGVIEDAISAGITKVWAEGSLKTPIGDKMIGLFLKAALGGLASASNADGSGLVYDHTITIAQSAIHQSITLFIDDPLAAQDYKHANGVVTSFELRYELNSLIEVTIGLMAKKGATATLTPSVATENRFLPQHLTFKVAANLAGLGAASAVVIKSASLNFNPNTESDDVLGSTAPADFLNKQMVVEGTVEAIYQDEATFKTAFLAGTAKALRFDLVNTDVTIGTSANPQLRVDLAKVVFQELGRPFKLNDVVTQTLKFKAFYSTSDSKLLTILLTNLQASY